MFIESFLKSRWKSNYAYCMESLKERDGGAAKSLKQAVRA